jgi:hypothetical protein
MFIDLKMQVPGGPDGMVVQFETTPRWRWLKVSAARLSSFRFKMNAQAKVIRIRLTTCKIPKGTDRARPHHHGTDEYLVDAPDVSTFPTAIGYPPSRSTVTSGTRPTTPTATRCVFRDPTVDGLKTATPMRRVIRLPPPSATL